MLLAAGLAIMGAVPARAATLFALVDTGQVYASADGGASWAALATLPISDGAGLVAGTTPQRLFLASGSGTIYRSMDTGAHWSAGSTIPASDVVDLTGYESGLIVLTRSGTVWRSTDDGASFQLRGAITASDLAGLCSAGGTTFCAVTRTGLVWRSSDAGISWTAFGSLPASDVVTVRSVSPDLFAITATGLTWKSSDLGASWSAVGTMSQLTVAGMTRFQGRLMAATREGLVALSATGVGWIWVGAVNQVHVTALATDEPQVSGVPEIGGPLGPLSVSAPWPNPCRLGGAGVSVDIEPGGPSDVLLELFDCQGRLAARRVLPSSGGTGPLRLTWDPGDVSAGSYFLRVASAQGISQSRRVVFLR